MTVARPNSGTLFGYRPDPMSTSLRDQLDQLASTGGGGQPDPLRNGKRLARRSLAQIEATLAKVVAAVRATGGKGLRAEDIRRQLGLDVREMPRVLKEGVRAKKLKAKGRKRATTYRAA